MNLCNSDLHWHEAIALEAGDLANAMLAARAQTEGEAARKATGGEG